MAPTRDRRDSAQDEAVTSGEAPTLLQTNGPGSDSVATTTLILERSEPVNPGPNTLVSDRMAHTVSRAEQLQRLRLTSFEARYELGEPLGVGGMGEVLSCHDTRIGRDVALKLMRPEHAARDDLSVRFEREAKIQGRLEHPSIVPVYDIGARADGSVYFTMKRIGGLTLERILDGLREGDDALTERYSRRRLLTAFNSLCLAVAYAHSRGVVHRDLKPSNVILGEFGEVNILDWGVAKVLDGSMGEEDAPSVRSESLPPTAPTPSPLGRGELVTAPTAVGAMVGTPGYMAPEQVHGYAVDTRSDIYSLGVILFEMLAGEPLHPRTNVNQVLTATITGSSEPRPGVRRPDREVPPELDELCEQATAVAPKDRFASARELSDAIERFLDGDRDESRRRELAQEHSEAAARLLSASSSASAESRTAALREINRALALDPQCELALATLAAVVTLVPEDLPPEAVEELTRQRAAVRRRSAKVAVTGFLVAWLMLPLLWWVQPHDFRLSLPFYVLGLCTMAVVWRTAKTGAASPANTLLTAALTLATSASTCVLFGPFILVPMLVLACATVLIVNSRANRRVRRAVLAMSVVALSLPFLLQQLDVLPKTYAFADGVMKVLPWSAPLQEGPVLLFLWMASTLVVLIAVAVAGRTVDALTRAEHRQFAQSWQLRQIFPDHARPAAPASKRHTP